MLKKAEALASGVLDREWWSRRLRWMRNQNGTEHVSNDVMDDQHAPNGTDYESVSNPSGPSCIVWHLPTDTGQLAQRYAACLGVEAIRVPLQRFLDDAIGQTGLNGLGLAVWETSNRPPVLCVYALTDLRIVSTRENPSPDVITSRLYALLWHDVMSFEDAPMDVSISFRNIPDDSVNDGADGFPTGLHDLFLGPHSPGDRVAMADLVVLRREVVRAA